MRLVIIGCRGFLGTNVTEIGLRNGHDVFGLSTSRKPATGEVEYLRNQIPCDLSLIIQDFAPDAIIHLAGPASVDASFADPASDFRASLVTWLNTLETVRRSSVRPIVLFPSSAAVYGNPEMIPTPEEAVLAPISPYGFHKAACELVAQEYSECFGLDTVICRFFSLLGSTQQRLLIWELYTQLAGPNPTVWIDGTGTETRDYLDVSDAASAMFQLIHSQLQARNEKSYRPGNRLIVNIASGHETNVLALAERLRNLVAPEKSIRCAGNERKGAPARWLADIRRFRSLIPCWEPKPFSIALSECVAEWQKCQPVA